jgi:hypothetical protein
VATKCNKGQDSIKKSELLTDLDSDCKAWPGLSAPGWIFHEGIERSLSKLSCRSV